MLYLFKIYKEYAFLSPVIGIYGINLSCFKINLLSLPRKALRSSPWVSRQA